MMRAISTSPLSFFNCRRLRLVAGSLLGLLFLIASTPSTLPGIVYINPSTNNITAPTGDYQDSGWQWQGKWGLFLGTAISPTHFISAQHINNNFSIGSVFNYNGTNYTTVAKFDDPSADLTIWQVSGTFSSWAPLYTASTEVGKELVVFGRGREKGAEVIANSELKGWQWGSFLGTQRWGTNVVAGTANDGTLLAAAFDASGGVNEAHLSEGDSGGSMFIQDGGVWKLAGINYTVSGPFNTVASDSGSFVATLYDRGGLWDKTSGTWTLIPDLTEDIPSYFYSTRISSEIDWITSIVGIPETSTISLVIGALLLPTAIFRRRIHSPRPANAG